MLTTTISCAGLEKGKNITQDSIDTNNLKLREWEPLNNFSDIILKVHGYNDYSNSFDLSGRFFANNDIKSISFDLNGFGENTNRGEWFGLDIHIKNLAEIIQNIKRKNPKKNIYLMGESMGGAIATSLVKKHKELPIDGVILVAPAIWNFTETNFIKSIPLKFMSKVFPKLQLSGKKFIKVRASNNNEILKELSEDKFFIHKPTLESLQGIITLMDESFIDTKEYLENPTFETLILLPLRDEIIPRKPIISIISDLNSKKNFLENIKINIYEDSYHMILRDLQGEKILNDIKDWIFRNNKKKSYNNNSILKQLKDAIFVHRLD